MKIDNILKQYDFQNLTIGTLGGHSGLEVGLGAKKQGLKTVAVCQKGREKTYTKYYRNLFDKIILVDKFAALTTKRVVKQLQEINTIFVQSRYFWVYCNHQKIETSFPVPIFGTRGMVKLEERDVPKNQYYLMKKAGIKYPKIYQDPKKIDRLVIVKVPESLRVYERAFFLAQSFADYQAKSHALLKEKLINQKDLQKAVIEEYVLGAPVNFNFFYSPLSKKIELMGTDKRQQTSIGGLIGLPATEQIEVLKYLRPQYVEVGHLACTVKESLLEKAFALAEKLVKVAKKEFPPGIIGPFALQSAITPGPPKEEIVTFDLSLRLPGSPGIAFTPYSGYLHGQSISYGERIGMEIKKAIKENRLEKILT